MAKDTIPSAHRSYKFRIHPNKAQEAALEKMLGLFCDLYNAGLQQRQEAYRRQGKSLTVYDQCAEIKDIRSEDEVFARYGADAAAMILRRLDKAFKAFFRRIKNGETPGFPRFKSKHRFHTAEIRIGRGATINCDKRLSIKGIPGGIKIRWHRDIPLEADLRTAIIKRKNGRWYVVFQAILPLPAATPRPFAPIGIDLGLTSLVAFSSGETIPTPQYTRNAAKALRRAQRAVARKKRNSYRQRKARQRVARLHEKVANQRRDFSHKLSCSIVGQFSHIAMENLNVKGLSAGMLAKSVNNAAWTQLTNHISYKAEWAGSVLELVNPRGTSQTCPCCGEIKRKTLRERLHCCHCGATMDRDVAAAQIILSRANWSGTGQQALSWRGAA